MILKSKHIFIVEDNLQNRVVFQMALTRQGATVDFERWGRDTLAQLKKLSFTYHLIILDLMLAEGVSGFEIYNEIRDLPNYADTPIVAVSAMDPALAIPKAQAQGFAGFITKPIDNHLFPQQIAKLIDGEKVWYTG
jgi:two-component system, cell cycle response regulator DivK